MSKVYIIGKRAVFVCDRKRCAVCDSERCSHTLDIEHAVFDGEKTMHNLFGSYWESDDDKPES